MSKEWVGRVSDKYLTKTCGLLNYLEPGDVIQLTVDLQYKTLLEFVVQRLNYPPFTKGKKQLT